MATALETVDKVTVTSLRRAFNQAAVLTAEHAIKIDSAEVLALGDEVTYTDPDLGFCFRGFITNVQELWDGGEGIVYSCADIYRWLMKEPALLGGSSKIKIEGQNPDDAIDEILGGITTPTSCKLQWDTAELTTSFTLEPINMAGQSVGEWIQRILNQTEDTVCWIEYMWDGTCGQYVSLLKFKQIDAISGVGLKKGDYTVIDPDEGDNPLIVAGANQRTLDGKYHKVCVEACGDFQRFSLRYIPPAGPPQYDGPTAIFTFKYWIPEDWATPRYIDADGNCREDWFVRLTLGQPAIGLVSIDQHNLEAKQDPSTKQWYWEVKVQVYGIYATIPPPPPQISAYFSYTGYLGPLVACQAASGISDTEGRFLMQRPDLFKFTGPTNHDDTAQINAVLSRLYKRYCEGPDRSSSFRLHLKGLDADLGLGAAITSPELGSPTIREIAYDFRTRDINIGCSDAPLRPEIENAEFRARFRAELDGNTYLTDKQEDSCMCGGQVYTEADSGQAKANPSDEGRGGGVESWDCNETFVCVKRDDAMGQYATEDECLDDCFPQRWRFIPCVGCVPTEDWADYFTKEECDADNPDPFDSSFNCNPSGGVSGEAPDPGVSGISGPKYNDKQCIGVSCKGGGDGGFFIGFIRRIKSDRKGHIVIAECADYEFPVISAGFNGWVSWMVSCMCSNSVCIPFYNMGRFSHGLLMEMYDVNAGFEAWTEVAASGAAFVGTPCSVG